MSLIKGPQYSERIGHFIVREEEGTAEIEVIDAGPFESRELAESWLSANGSAGVDYFVCAPVSRTSIRRG